MPKLAYFDEGMHIFKFKKKVEIFYNDRSERINGRSKIVFLPLY